MCSLTLLACAALLLGACACSLVSQAFHFFHINAIPVLSFLQRYYLLRCGGVESAADARMTKMNQSYQSSAMHVRVLQLSSLFHYRIYTFNSNIFILTLRHGRQYLHHVKCWEMSNTNIPQYFQQTIFKNNFITYTVQICFHCKPEKALVIYRVPQRHCSVYQQKLLRLVASTSTLIVWVNVYKVLNAQ
jgi:hypothetical protein